MVNHLAEKGHKHIGFITEMSQYNTTFEERIRGYQVASLIASGLPLCTAPKSIFTETKQTPSDYSVLTAISEYLRLIKHYGTGDHQPGIGIYPCLLEAHDSSLAYSTGCSGPAENLSCATGYNISIIDQNPRFIGRQARAAAG